MVTRIDTIQAKPKKKKEEGQTINGKFYPGASPGFTPPTPTQTVTPGKNGSQIVDGKEVTKEDYNQMLRVQKLGQTPINPEILQQLPTQTQGLLMSEQVKRQEALNPQLKALREGKQEIQTRTQEQQAVAASLGTQAQPFQFGTELIGKELAGNVMAFSNDKSLKGFAQSVVGTAFLPSFAVLNAARMVPDVYENIKGILTGSDVSNVKTAKQNIDNSLKGIDEMIKLIEKGDPSISPSDAKFYFEQMADSLEELDAYANKIGFENIKYWAKKDGGKDLNTYLKRKRNIEIPMLRKRLDDAITQGQIIKTVGGVV